MINYNIEEPDFCILIDQSGSIDYMGNLSDPDFRTNLGTVIDKGASKSKSQFLMNLSHMNKFMRKYDKKADMDKINDIVKFLRDEYLPALAYIYLQQGVKGRYSHWLKSEFKLTKARIFLGGMASTLPIGRVEINIRMASFLKDEFYATMPDLS